jgi:hypothetical protein
MTAGPNTIPSRRAALWSCPRFGRRYPWCACLVVVISLVRCCLVFHQWNHTFDEPSHLSAAVSLYDSRHDVLMVEHGPVQRWVIGLPLIMGGDHLPQYRHVRQLQTRAQAVFDGLDLLFKGRLPYWSALIRARAACLFVFAPLLFFYLYKLIAWLVDQRAAFVAVLLLSVDPTFLANAPQATTDMPGAATFVAATYYMLRLVLHPTRRGVILAGISLGIAIATKFTGILLLPGVAALMAMRWYRRRRRTSARATQPEFHPPPHRALRPVKLWLAVLVLAFFAMWATYLFDFHPWGEQILFRKPLWARVPAWVRHLPLPMPPAIWGNLFLAGMDKGRIYFNGHTGSKPHLGYFVEAIALKSTTATVVLLFLALLFFVFGKRSRPTWRAAAILLPPSFLFLVASVGPLQIGIRHVLPVIPFLYGFIALVLARGRRLLLALPFILLSIVESAAAHPSYISYFNLFAGGTRHGDYFLSDSNVDVGQDVYHLSQFLNSGDRNQRPCAVWVNVTGLEGMCNLFGLSWCTLPTPGKGWDEMVLPATGRLAMGRSVKDMFFPWLPDEAIVARIGGSINVYDLENPSLRASRKIHKR